MPYHHLTPSERKVIYSMRSMPDTYTQQDIARALGRSQSTISRELRRNGERDGRYNPHIGNVLYCMRRQRLYCCTKRDQAELMGVVEGHLQEKWAPEQIAGRLREMLYPQDPSMWVSHETIYEHVRQDKAQGGTLYRHLRRGRKTWGKRGAGRHPNAFIKGRVSIEQRPPAVSTREQAGDWEGDTFYGRHRKGCIVTLVERKTGLLAASTMPDAKAGSLNAAVLRSVQDIPTALLNTLTVDNGKEFAHFTELEKALDLRVFFAHPYSAWERATN